MKQVIFSTLAIFVLWFVLDFVVHGILLQDLYAQTAHLWRPMKEIEGNWWMHIITLVNAFLFSWLWCCNVGQNRKNPKGGISFGLKIGLIYGLSMGIGMFAVMPIPFSLALWWFFSSVIGFSLAGIVASLFIKECCCPKSC